MPLVCAHGRGGDASGCVPVVLRVQGLRIDAQAVAGRLLCVLFLRQRAVPAGAGGHRLLRRRVMRAAGCALARGAGADDTVSRGAIVTPLYNENNHTNSVG